VLFFPLLCVTTVRSIRADSVLALLALLMSLPAAAIAFGLAARRHRSAVSPGARRRAGAGLALGWLEIALVLFVAFALPTLGRSRPMANRVKCMGNLRLIGQGVLLYSNDYSGQFPPDLDALMLTQDLTFEVLVCPSTNDTRAEGPTTQAALQALHTQSGHCSYVYVGGGLTSQTATARHVIAFEPMSNHGGAGMNVLLGDGSVEFLPQAQATSMLAELKAGYNPPRPRSGAMSGTRPR
jgi:prepilin-type processing-associated H-X9-DG protein